jgi:hypothetical protein
VAFKHSSNIVVGGRLKEKIKGRPSKETKETKDYPPLYLLLI